MPHLTPEKFLGSNVLPPEWAAANVAFVCFTPFPNGLKTYVEEPAPERYFLHIPNSEVRLCRYQRIPFIVVSEVYEFAVGATTVEELVHHGISHIVAIGYAGAFNAVPVGQPFVATDTMSDLLLAAHYGVREYVRSAPTEKLYQLVNACIQDDAADWGHYTVWTGNGLYRESPQLEHYLDRYGHLRPLSLAVAVPVYSSVTGQFAEFTLRNRRDRYAYICHDQKEAGPS